MLGISVKVPVVVFDKYRLSIKYKGESGDDQFKIVSGAALNGLGGKDGLDINLFEKDEKKFEINR